MALFPAYSTSNKEVEDIESQRSEGSNDVSTVCTEAQLLASDSEDEPAPRRPGPEDIHGADFYVDRKLDRGNLRVSTLYYPGRPQYRCAANAKGADETRARRYFWRRACESSDEAAAAAARAQSHRRLLAQAPHDVGLWESFIDFQEACCGPDAALAAAEEGAARLPASARLRARLLAALRVALPPHAFLDRLRDMLAKEKSVSARTELWEWLLDALAAAPAAAAPQLRAAAAAALADTRACVRAYPRLLHALGTHLRAAGLWERLALLVELVAAMNLAAGAFPSPEPAEVERRLLALEDEATGSGLPLGAVWVRVERARGAAHWRTSGSAAADPERAPLPHDVAELLLPMAAPDALQQLAMRLLMLAKVPLLPGSEWAARWAGRPASLASDAEALLPLLAAAAELPAAHRAHAQAADARRALLLLLDPPHYFCDDAGYLRWVEALWDAAAAHASGPAALALTCWRLRWMAVLLRLADGAEAARLRGRARSLLRRGPAHPLPFAEFALLERCAGAHERALGAATHALRAALADSSVPQHYCLYVARVAAGAGGAAGSCALVCAVLRRPLPAELRAPEPADVAAALQRCERECDAIEAAADEPEEADAAAVLLPAHGEWARARALLAPPRRRAELLRRACAAAPDAAQRGGATARYWEESGEALAAGADARLLLPLFPHNVRLALESASAPLWAWRAGSAPERLRALAPRGDVAALARLLPPLLQALRCDFAPHAAEQLARAARRAARPCAGALLWALRLEAEARAPSPRLARALFAALDAAPCAKWLYVRGAAWCGAEAAALADALLERQLRLHALPDELRGLPPQGCE